MISRRTSARKKAVPAPVVGPGIQTLKLTKIDVAEALIRSAVRQFFEDAHPVPVYALANAAREIVTNIGTHSGVPTLLHAVANRRATTIWDLTSDSRRLAAFFKHADRDPEETIEFREDEIDAVLAVACQDFGRVTGGMPVEAQVFELWVYSLAFKRVTDAPMRGQRLIKLAIQQFPGIRTADRRTQKKLGLDVVNRLINDPALQMQYSRQVQMALC